MVSNNIRNLIIGIVAGIIANELGWLPPFLEKYLYIIVIFGICPIVYFLYNREKRMIRRLGIKEIYSRKDKSIESIINEPAKSYEWFGLSAYKEITDIYNIRAFVKKINVKYEYYILNNLSKINLTTCQVEREDEHVKDNIDCTLRTVQDKKFRNLKCYSHEIIPSFRLVFIDDKKLYLGYYPPKGYDSPVIEICREERNGDANPTESCNLYFWFKYYFETMKKETIKRCIEKEVLENMIGETNILISDELKRKIEINSGYLFSWEEIPGNDSLRLTDFLISNYYVDWVKTATITKIDNSKTIMITNGENILSLNLDEKNNELNIEINNRRTDKFIVKTENGKLNIYSSSDLVVRYIENFPEYPLKNFIRDIFEDYTS